MGRKRKRDIIKEYSPPPAQSIEWDREPDEPMEPENFGPILMKVIRALSDGGEGLLANQLMWYLERSGEQTRRDVYLISAYYTIGMIRGFTLCRESSSWPKKGSLPDAIWNHLRKNPGITNTELCRVLELQRREIAVPAGCEQDMPKGKAASFPNALRYSHRFQVLLSEQRAAYDQYNAADNFFRHRYSKPDTAENVPVNPPKRRRLDFEELLLDSLDRDN